MAKPFGLDDLQARIETVPGVPKGSSAQVRIYPNHAAIQAFASPGSSALRDSAAMKASDNNEQERRQSYLLKFLPN